MLGCVVDLPFKRFFCHRAGLLERTFEAHLLLFDSAMMSQQFGRSYDLLAVWAVDTEISEGVLIDGAGDRKDVLELFLRQSIEQASTGLSDAIFAHGLLKGCEGQVLLAEAGGDSPEGEGE
jgi:hypothetical protein